MDNKIQENKIKFYSPKNIISKNCTYNVIFGERSNGKSYAILKYGLEQYIKTKGQIAIVRRWKEDVTGRRASGIWSAINDNNDVSKISNGEFTKIHYWNGKFYLANVDDNGKMIFSEEDVVGHCFALSENEHNKSISFPKITTLLFDEFLTNKMYLNDEFVAFMNTVSTIIRQRTNVKIFMLGNTVNKYCPYFGEMGLNHIVEMLWIADSYFSSRSTTRIPSWSDSCSPRSDSSSLSCLIGDRWRGLILSSCNRMCRIRISIPRSSQRNI